MLQNKKLQYHLSLLKTYLNITTPNITLINARFISPFSTEELELLITEYNNATTNRERNIYKLELNTQDLLLEFDQTLIDPDVLNNTYWDTISNFLPNFYAFDNKVILTYLPAKKYLINQFKDVKTDDIVDYFNQTVGVDLAWDSYKQFV
jgi:hypothetical protein